MYNVGPYPGSGYLPSPVDVRKLYAETKAEKEGALAVESDRAARAVVDDVNSVHYSMRRLDHYEEFDKNPEKGAVEVDATPKKLNFLQRATGIGETPIEEIANRNREKGAEVTNVSGTLSKDEMDVVVSFAGEKEPLVYSKNVDEAGNVFFQRGNELVSLDANGNLVMQQVD